MKGRVLIVVNALYGLRTSAARFHEHLTDNIKKFGYIPSKADPNLFYENMRNHYEYVAS